MNTANATFLVVDNALANGMTAQAGHGACVVCRQTGAENYLTEPVDPQR